MNGTVVVITFAVALAVPGFTRATHDDSPSGGSPKDFVVGVGEDEFGTIIHVSAHGDAQAPSDLAAEPHGQARVTNEALDLDIVIEVTCLRVTGDVATVGGTILEGSTGVPFGIRGMFLDFRDSDEPGGEGDLHDVYVLQFTDNPSPLGCPHVPAVPQAPIVRGNYVVHEGAAKP